MKEKKEYPYCFGKLEKVFPMGKNGLRTTPESCLVCYCKTECLKSALENPGGLKVKEEKVDRAYATGMIGFLERWSQKKVLNRKLKHIKKDRC
jgi:hypothetical protein